MFTWKLYDSGKFEIKLDLIRDKLIQAFSLILSLFLSLSLFS